MSSWCQFGVAGGIEWPTEEAIVTFGKWKLLAFPSSKEFEPSLQIDTEANLISDVQSRSICNELLSICAWCCEAPAHLLDGGCGSTRANPRQRGPRGGYLTSILNSWPYNRGPLTDSNQRLAVALYREALWQDSYASIPYAALGYFKILEIEQGAKGRKTWMSEHLENAVQQSDEPDRFLQAVKELGVRPDEYLYQNCRTAVAHASFEPVVNPDDAEQVRGLSICTPILEALSRQYIRDELKVSDDPWG